MVQIGFSGDSVHDDSWYDADIGGQNGCGAVVGITTLVLVVIAVQ